VGELRSKGHICSQESRVGDGLGEANDCIGHDYTCLITTAVFLTGSDTQLHSLHPHLLVHVRVLSGQTMQTYTTSQQLHLILASFPGHVGGALERG